MAQRLIGELPSDAIVVDVGGGASPFPRADYVLDAKPFEMLGTGSSGSIHRKLDVTPRYRRETWIRRDLCDHEPWPFADKFFDFATCSHLLEDLRDPIWVCHELCRVAKAGYVEVPSRVVEQSLGIENPRYAGFLHHRWLVSWDGECLDFRYKPHALHAVSDAIVARVGIRRAINPAHAIVAFTWKDSFKFREIIETSESNTIEELCAFSRRARALPELTVPSGKDIVSQAKRALYYGRLRLGRR